MRSETDDPPEDWLRDERLAEAERLDRLLGDAEVLAEIRADGFEGPRYEEFATELVRYGVAVIRAWTYRGMIFDQCARRTGAALPRLPTEQEITGDDANELALETVATAHQHFRDDVLVPGVWDPRRGASIKTFFIGQCLFRFPNVYRRWYGEVTRRYRVIDANADLDVIGHPSDSRVSVERDVIIAISASELTFRISGQRYLLDYRGLVLV